MPENKIILPITTSEANLQLTIFGEGSGKTVIESVDAIENGEMPVQIIEGCFYEYLLSDKSYCLQTSDIVSQSKINPSSGRISPNIYVGTLSIDILKVDTQKKCGEVRIEVQSVKTTYRTDYRTMLEAITEKCIDLLLQHSSPVSQYFEVDFNADAKTLYQRFAFIKSILDTIEFNDSVHKVITSPVTRWRESETVKDIRSVRRFNNGTIRQLSGANNRIDLPEDHPLKATINSIPSKIKLIHKTETVNTPENRFVKHALVSFQTFCSEFRNKVNIDSRIAKEALLLEDKLGQYLNHSVFKEISTPTSLHLNSPVLQRKEGYREILRVWLMFDLAAKLVWHGGDDIYSGNKRDVAVLYEYWLFFKLLDIVKEIFKINSVTTDDLIESTSDGLGLKLKQGRFLPVKGVYDSATRKLNVEFSYNKTFAGDSQYPVGGSWTRNLRPDYTLTIWPFGIEQVQAEHEELIVHIHFDAKYKIEDLKTVFGNDEDLLDEKEDQKKGTYKRADLLKMHTYRDAIRRTAGAYILYPGSISQNKKGFHELLPGLGAFAISPSKINSGEEELKKFLHEVVAHFMNRASQREKISYKTYDTYKDDNINQVNEDLPEPFGLNRNLVPDDTFVLIGYYKKENLEWIQKTGLFNARAESRRGSLRLGPGEAGAKYLLLHTESETKTSKLFKISEIGPRVFSKQTLINKHYPSEPSGDFYLVYKIEPVTDTAFLNKKWDLNKIEKYKSGRGSALPFSITLTELMRAVDK
ncbi:hypothetical protein BH10BAC3_BH10BAC3_39640 [soil metagenome]